MDNFAAVTHIDRHITNGILCFSPVVVVRRLCAPRQAIHELLSGTGQLSRHKGRTVVMRHAICVAGGRGGIAAHGKQVTKGAGYISHLTSDDDACGSGTC